jgi:hypothetical protein
MRRAGASISGSGVNGQSLISNHLAPATSNRSLQNSLSTSAGTFKAALEQIEDEILLLAHEVNFCRKEVGIQKVEMETIAEVSDSQCVDIERYLKKEVVVLDEVIVKQRVRQTAEFSRLNN